MENPAGYDPVAAAGAFAREIGARVDEFEDGRRLPGDLALALAKAGLFRMLVPRVYGGLEARPDQILGAIETLATADASVGWCVMIGATTALTAAYLPQAYAREIFADPLQITGGVFAPMGKAIVEGDEVVVSGRWNWASGSANCGWLLGGCVFFEGGEPRLLANGAPEVRMVFFPKDQIDLEDTWRTSGLRGTGSGDMIVFEQRAPADRSVSLALDAPRVEGALYAFPPFGLLALGVAAVACGNARGALDELIELAGAKTPQGSRRRLAERSDVQAEVAKSEAALRSARAYLYDVVGTAFAVAEQGGRLGLGERADIRLAATHMARTSAEVCRTAYDLAGGSSVFLASPLQRRLRDALAATQHIMVARPTYEAAGRVLLGVGGEPDGF